MIQQYALYTPEHQWVWKELFGRQIKNLKTKGTELHNKHAALLHDVFNEDFIPKLNDLSDTLLARTGWQIHIVKGFIPAGDFLNLLAEKKFAASTWLRRPEELDYLEEPDMFHDVFGHLPILCDEAYANFVNRVGMLGKKFGDCPTCIDLIERFYWYTIEFGLVKEEGRVKILGAGIISSFGESNRIFEDTNAEIKDFSLDEILYLPFDKSALQPVYYVAKNVEQLYAAVELLEGILEETNEQERASTI